MSERCELVKYTRGTSVTLAPVVGLSGAANTLDPPIVMRRSWHVLLLWFGSYACAAPVAAQNYWSSAELPGTAQTFRQVWADGDSAIYYAGIAINGFGQNALMRYADGQWEALDSLNGPINSVVKHRDTLFVGGAFDYAPGTTSHAVEFYDGVSWKPYGEFENAGVVRMLKVLEDTLYAVGSFTSIDGVVCEGVAKRVGGAWMPVGSFPNDDQVLVDIVNYRDTLVVIGYVTFNSGRGIAYLDQDGYWKLLGPGILGSLSGAHTLAVYQNKLYVGGQISLVAGNPGQEIMRWNGSGFEGLGQGLQFSENNTTSFCDVRAMVEHDDLLFVGGGCNYAGGLPSHGVAVWDGVRWCSVPGHPNQSEGVLGMDFYRDTLFITSGHLVDGDTVNLAAKFVGGSYIDSCGAPVHIGEYIVLDKGKELSWSDQHDGTALVQGLPRGILPYTIFDAMGGFIEQGMLSSDAVSPVRVRIPPSATGLYLFQVGTQVVHFLITR